MNNFIGRHYGWNFKEIQEILPSSITIINNNENQNFKPL